MEWFGRVMAFLEAVFTSSGFWTLMGTIAGFTFERWRHRDAERREGAAAEAVERSKREEVVRAAYAEVVDEWARNNGFIVQAMNPQFEAYRSALLKLQAFAPGPVGTVAGDLASYLGLDVRAENLREQLVGYQALMAEAFSRHGGSPSSDGRSSTPARTAGARSGREPDGAIRPPPSAAGG